jgi:endonuclease I
MTSRTSNIACEHLKDDEQHHKEGKGPVARATLYFLARYPEKHRNWAVNERRGNRNPFIDHPD